MYYGLNEMKYLLTTLILFSSWSYANDLSNYKSICKEIGYKEKTEDFGECVLKLRKKKSNQQATTNTSNGVSPKNIEGNNIAQLKEQHRQEAERQFAQMAGMYELQQRQYEQQLRAYEEQKRQYDEQQAKIQKEKERKKNMKLIELGLRMATGQSATDASMATAGMIPLPRAPQQPTLQFNEQYRVTLPDGSLYQCTYNPNFKSAQCN